VTCSRKRVEVYFRAVHNAKLGTHCFKQSSYKSCSSLQMMRTELAQSESAHSLHGRSRLQTTGRSTLTRTLPKYQETELPSMGHLLEAEALVEMLEKVFKIFERADADELGFGTPADMAATLVLAGQ
jgi:hypothetical protein